MIGNASFQRKIIYGVLIALLLIPVSYISRPASRQDDNKIGGGGTLAQMRIEHRLSPSELGNIDPTSESMKLATFGLKGIAVNLLWGKANRFKNRGDWDSLAATLNQIAKLQPNFLSVWQFQSWNLSYNVSVEFDDYRTRYHWVKKGMDFLKEGIIFNPREPVLFWEMGWMFGHKLGKADEYVQYRRLYRDDRDFHDSLRGEINVDHAQGADGKPDNWLTGREWFLRGQRLVDDFKIPIRGNLLDNTGRVKRGKNPVVFHSHPPKWKMNFASAIEEEGILGEKAQVAWKEAGDEWKNDYGSRELPSSQGYLVRLNGLRQLQSELQRLQTQMDEMLEEIREGMVQEIRRNLTDAERQAVDTPKQERTLEQIELAAAAEKQMEIDYQELAKQAPRKLRRDAEQLARQIQMKEGEIQATIHFRDTVAYEYWQARCDIEQTDTAIRARKFIYEAEQSFRDKANLEDAKEKYENAWNEWAKIFDEYPVMVESPDAEDIYEAVMKYKQVLDWLDLPWPPKDFKLHRLMAYYDETYSPDMTPDSVQADQESN